MSSLILDDIVHEPFTAEKRNEILLWIEEIKKSITSYEEYIKTAKIKEGRK